MYSGNTGCEAGTHLALDAGPSLAMGCTRTHSHLGCSLKISSSPVPSSDSYCVFSVQAGSTDMDGGAAVGHMSAVLRPCGHAHLCREHGRALRLVQERVRHGAGQLFLGLLLHSGSRWLHQ